MNIIQTNIPEVLIFAPHIFGDQRGYFLNPSIRIYSKRLWMNGFRGNTDEVWKIEERVKHDMEYIYNWTFIWDIQIIFQTVFRKKAFQNAG